MGKNHVVIVRLSKDQKERIVNGMNAAGCKNISEFVRKRCLENSLFLETKVNEIHQAICSSKGQNKPYKINPSAKPYSVFEESIHQGYDNQAYL